MSYLVLLKRFEIWLLLGVVAALIAFALQPSADEVADSGNPKTPKPVDPVVLVEDSPEENPETSEAPVEEPASFQVDSVVAEPTEEGRIVEVTLLARSDTGSEVRADESRLRATTDEGREAPRFFEPFREDPIIPADEASLIQVRFWLESVPGQDPAKSLWLEFQGERTLAQIPEDG